MSIAAGHADALGVRDLAQKRPPNRRTLFGQLASPFGRGVTGADLVIHLFSRIPRTSSVLEWLGSGVADCPGKKLRGPLGGWGPLSGGLCSAGSYSPTPWRGQYHRRWR